MDKWDKAIDKLLSGGFQEAAPSDNFLEIPERIGSETMDYDPTGDIIDYLVNVVTRRLGNGEIAGNYLLGPRLNKAIAESPSIVKHAYDMIYATTGAILVYNGDPPTLSFQKFIYI